MITIGGLITEDRAAWENLFAGYNWARARGCVRVYWHTQTSNTTARRLYDQVALDKRFMQYQIPLGS